MCALPVVLHALHVARCYTSPKSRQTDSSFSVLIPCSCVWRKLHLGLIGLNTCIRCYMYYTSGIAYYKTFWSNLSILHYTRNLSWIILKHSQANVKLREEVGLHSTMTVSAISAVLHDILRLAKAASKGSRYSTGVFHRLKLPTKQTPRGIFGAVTETSIFFKISI